MVALGIERRARRALERQLDYQRAKAARVRGEEAAVIASMIAASRRIREQLERIQPLPSPVRVLEVGSGAQPDLLFRGRGEGGGRPLGGPSPRAVPSLAGAGDDNRRRGEKLPFADAAFDVVLSDNVVDHAENPRRIVEEMARVLVPGGLLYFTVNVHHSVYHLAASLHAAWRTVGVPFEITPFADHTVHLTLNAARRLFDGLPLRFVEESNTVAEAKEAGKSAPRRHAGDALKRLFFKNAELEVIAVKEDQLARLRPGP